MINTLRLTIATLLSMVTLLATSVNAGEFNSVINIGDPMPTFNNLPGIDGSNLSSDDITESVVVLVSLANHCPWVKGMDQQLVDLVNEFKDKDVRVIGFSVSPRDDDRLPAMIKHAEEYGYNFSYVYDESQQLGRDLGATRTPEYFVFNTDRSLTYMGLITNSPIIKVLGVSRKINGDPTEFYASDAINSTLEGKAVTVAETRAHGCSVKYSS